MDHPGSVAVRLHSLHWGGCACVGMLSKGELLTANLSSTAHHSVVDECGGDSGGGGDCGGDSGELLVGAAVTVLPRATSRNSSPSRDQRWGTAACSATPLALEGQWHPTPYPDYHTPPA